VEEEIENAFREVERPEPEEQNPRVKGVRLSNEVGQQIHVEVLIDGHRDDLEGFVEIGGVIENVVSSFGGGVFFESGRIQATGEDKNGEEIDERLDNGSWG